MVARLQQSGGRDARKGDWLSCWCGGSLTAWAAAAASKAATGPLLLLLLLLTKTILPLLVRYI